MGDDLDRECIRRLLGMHNVYFSYSMTRITKGFCNATKLDPKMS